MFRPVANLGGEFLDLTLSQFQLVLQTDSWLRGDCLNLCCTVTYGMGLKTDTSVMFSLVAARV
jgi:hypothetical protein